MFKWIRAGYTWISEHFRSCPDVDSAAGTPREFFVIGHRGSPTVEVENTMASFRRAVEVEGANGLELDLCLTRDRQVVIWHDWDPDSSIAHTRQLGLEPDVCYKPLVPEDGDLCKRISQLTLAEFRQHYGYADKESDERVDVCIPTFDEFVEWAAQRQGLDIVFFDVKLPTDEVQLVPEFMDAIRRTLDHHRPLFRHVFETAEPVVLRAMKAHSPDYAYTLDVEPHAGIVLFPEECSCTTAAMEHRNTFATPQRPRDLTVAPWMTFRRIVQHDLQACSKHNSLHPEACIEAVVGFTVNDDKEMECLVRSGIHGIQSDKPAMLRQVAERLGRTRGTQVREQAGVIG